MTLDGFLRHLILGAGRLAVLVAGIAAVVAAVAFALVGWVF